MTGLTQRRPNEPLEVRGALSRFQSRKSVPWIELGTTSLCEEGNEREDSRLVGTRAIQGSVVRDRPQALSAAPNREARTALRGAHL